MTDLAPYAHIIQYAFLAPFGVDDHKFRAMNSIPAVSIGPINLDLGQASSGASVTSEVEAKKKLCLVVETETRQVTSTDACPHDDTKIKLASVRSRHMHRHVLYRIERGRDEKKLLEYY